MSVLKFFSTITSVIAFSFTVKCQENYFKISAQYRVRPEVRHGYKTLAYDTLNAAFFITQRTRLAFEYKKDNISTYASIQDIRTWGDEAPQTKVPGLAVNELWLQLALNKNFSLRLGRQEWVYDDQRLLGNVDWANATRSHDGILLKYFNKEKKLSWHVGGAFNQNGEPLFETQYILKNYKYLAFSWLKKEFKNSSVSATAIINGLNSTLASSSKTKASITFGPLYNFQNKKFKGLVGAYYQTGKTENNLLISAYMINTYAELHHKKIFAGLGMDYLSGNDDNTAANHYQSFSTLYATNHKFYGFMDYFVNIPADTKQRGLIDLYLRLGLNADKKITATIDVHKFYLAHENNLSASKIKKDLGAEVDALINYTPSPVINFQAGYSMMFATKNMELIKGGDKNNYNGWAFIMLKVSPTFFLQEIKK